jgi:hypothetical protein
MGREETWQGPGNRVLKSERAAQPNKPAGLGLHAKRDLLDRIGFDYRGLRMLVDLLTNLGQPKSSRRSIEQPHAEPLLQQSDAAADARFGHAKHARGRRESPVEDDGDKELQIVKVAHRFPPLLSRRPSIPRG